ncbi:MAG: flavodoxin domain-containing protein [Candidatus Nanoarchaeia archaeon]
MRNVLIVYKSKHNTTKQYAQWIHEEVESTLIDVDYLLRDDLKDFDIIVFGSWIFDDTIMIASHIEKYWEILQYKRVILFCDGLTHPQDEKMNWIYEKSIPKHIRDNIYFYPLGGELSFQSISFFEKLILKFKNKFREAHQIDKLAIKPILLKIYNLKVIE